MADDSENVKSAVRLLREAIDVLAQTNIMLTLQAVNQHRQ